ncbi:hypothetical protein [Phaeobacter inhibens]|uniref:hypothetical protein n=1 Tax=Phaeobacter inhibens TaxID=221822 RepID=UPI0009717654|nr:hypothetical protein [Phaeobacter inhibens]APX18107.1 hypothetical protein BWR17_19710 [Phaeobacter inhibens]UWR62785.1 hypothetical protein K4F88_19390 [Phaeobacter inhibens]
MTGNFPEPGQVFEYHFLWHWQQKNGQTEGSKKRPCCVTIIVTNSKGQHILFIAPITSKAPDSGRVGIQVPETEARRAKLDTVIPLWVMVDELNADVLEASYTLEDRTPRGQFTTAFTDLIIRSAQEVRRAGKLSVTSRT